ncbi:hypothetical protein ACTXT7_010489 [Hymenolepis weldensis]
MAAYMKGFAQFSIRTAWIFIIGNLQLLRIEFFVHPALGLSLALKAEVILFETICRKPPSADLFIHSITSIGVLESVEKGKLKNWTELLLQPERIRVSHQRHNDVILYPR